MRISNKKRSAEGFQPNLSIVIPLFNPDKIILSQINKSLKLQDYKGKTEVILADKGWGLSKQINWCISKSKYDLIVVLLQDCIPENKTWLKKLVEPFKDPFVVACVSNVTLPNQLWNQFTSFTKALLIKERGTIRPLLDGKGTAYRKSTLEKIGLFDEEHFRTAGEDFDTYMKLKRIGKIAYPKAGIIHYHPTTTLQRLKKIRQYSDGYGALTRLYGRKMHKGYAGFFLGLPLLGLVGLLINYPWIRGFRYSLHYLLLAPLVHIQYVRGFWRGFIKGRQTV